MSNAVGMPQLDPLRFDLRGSHLIEASAGTGKTWTIAALYVRLILGHGGQPPRLPADILVLTFTEAAAQELRDRIRARLSEAAMVFAAADEPDIDADVDTADAAPPSADPFLSALRAAYPPDRWPACARILDLAAQSMDEAAISTIHAWCARVLQEHAFDSAALFEQQLQPDLGEQNRQVAWDYWRACVAPLALEPLQQVLAVWSGPDKLLPLAAHLTREGLLQAEQDDLGPLLDRCAAQRQTRLQALKAPWVDAVDGFESWLDGLGKDWKVQARWWRPWIQTLRIWANDPDLESLDLKTGWERLVPAGIHDKWQGSGPAPEHSASAALQQLQLDLAALPSIRAPLLRHALGWMAARLKQLLSRTAVMGFDGLLTGLDAALDGDRGAPLAHTLRQQFPVVLIDEFQDTDPIQYRIFDRVYQVAGNDLQTALIFIGDPKQSIYGFRGADIHTYLSAVRACQDRVQTLACNYRSSHAMVEAVNACFGRAGSPVFPTGLPDEVIDFHPVRAQGRSEQWDIEGQAAPALSACWIEPEGSDATLTGADYVSQAAELCARRLAHILALGQQGLAGLRGPQGLSAIQPADMAILVNTHAEAHSMRSALGRLGVRSVYLSERETVYASPQASELAVWLDACAHPDDDRAVRAALATPLLGLDTATLNRLVDDERAWDAQLERFQGYRLCWQQRGVLPMLRQLMQDFDMPARLLADGQDGERRLTDCLHLAELLQQAGAHLDGEQAVLRYLRQQCQSPAGEDARRLRLESDENLVRVVTVHKSKGLEYPLVFLPFVCKTRSGKQDRGPFLLPQADGRHWVMEADAAQLRQLAQERLGEDVRKLYVALTRARHAVWMAMAPLANPESSGIGHVLGAGLRQAWQQQVDRHPDRFAWDDETSLSAGDTALPGQADDPAAWGAARRLDRPVVARSWWISSYSALRLADAGGVEASGPEATPDTATEDILREGRRDAAAGPLVAQAEPLPGAPNPGDTGLAAGLHEFPRGSEAGTFLHGLLEWAGQRGFRALDAARDLIARRCAVRGWEAHIDALHAWLQDFPQTLWQPDFPEQPAFRFDQLQACLPEMEFWLPASGVSVTHLDQLVTAGTFDAAARPALADGFLNGMFKGFIDLVVRAQSRYYVIDYKSNDLGPWAADYTSGALAAAMCAARYDVQMLMYILALHRQLRARLPDYDYARDMGGGMYLFLRGQQAPGQGLVSLRPPLALIDALDTLFSGQEVAHG